MAPNSKDIKNCNQCNQIIKKNQKVLQCDGDCKKYYHILCVNVGSEEYQKIVSKDDFFWLCSDCKSKRHKRRSTLNIISNGQNSPAQGLASNNINSNPKLDSIMAKIDELLKKQDDYEKKIDSLRQQISEFKTLAESIVEENIKLSSENIILQEKISKNQFEIENLKQIQYNKQIIISGAPIIDDDLMITVMPIINKIDPDVKAEEIINCHTQNNRSENSGEPPSIVVELINVKIKEKIVQKKKQKTLKVKEIFTSSSSHLQDGVIFINEKLSTYFNYLFKKARDLKRDGKLKFAWVKNGKVFIRKSEESAVIRVFNTDILNDFQ